MKPFIKLNLIPILFFLCLHLELNAQVSISGTVLSNENIVPGATLKLTSAGQDSTVLKTTVSDKKGHFVFQNIKEGNYTLHVTAIGYQPFFTLVKAVAKQASPLTIQLTSGNIAIEEVVINPPSTILMKGDTLEYDTKNFQTRDFADADEVVSQIPGVMIDEDGNVTAHGEPVTRIIVDGKEFFSTDPKIALKTLPADIIAKIQLIDEKSEQARFSGFDDGKRNKVINIVTKPDKKRGYFGKSSISKGDSDKFSINSSTNRFNGDKKIAFNLLANNINETNFAEQGRGGARRGNNNTDRGLSETYAAAVNYSNTLPKQNMEVSADYNFNSTSTVTNTLSNIEYLSEKQANQFRHQQNRSDIHNQNHDFGARVKWNIDSLNRIDFTPNIKYTSSNREVATQFNTIKDGNMPINNSDRSSDSYNDNFSFGGSLTFMHRFKKKGRTMTVTLSGNKSSNNADGLNLAITEYFKNAELNRVDTNNNKSVTNGYGSGFNNRIAFTENLSAHSRLQLQYSFRNTASYSNKETFEYLAETGQLGELRERLSNEFRNDYNYHNAGLSYIYAIKDSLRIQIGLQYQHGIRNNDRIVPYSIKTVADFNSILPAVSANFKFKNNKSLELTYNTQTNTPSIAQLQDFINNQNELRITNGNPNLDQEYAHTVRLQYKAIDRQSGRSLTTNLAFEYIQDKIINSIFLTDSSVYILDNIRLGAGGQYLRPVNADGAYSFRLNNSLGFPIEKLKINFNANTRLYLNNELAELNDVPISNKTFGYGQSIGINSKFSKRYIIGLNYHIDGRITSNVITQTERYHVINQRLSTNISLEPIKSWIIGSNLVYISNGGMLNYPSIETTLLNASIGKKIFKRSNGELTLKGFDLLNKAQNVSRRVTENNISNVISNTLNRYFLLSFTYNLRRFGGKSNVR